MKTLSEKKKILKDHLGKNVDFDIENVSQDVLKKIYHYFDIHYQDEKNKEDVIITELEHVSDNFYSITINHLKETKTYIDIMHLEM